MNHLGLEVFGGYIHTYKFSEAVLDEVVLDLIYEARDIDQRLGSEDKIDAWFEAKTKGLNDMHVVMQRLMFVYFLDVCVY